MTLTTLFTMIFCVLLAAVWTGDIPPPSSNHPWVPHRDRLMRTNNGCSTTASPVTTDVVDWLLSDVAPERRKLVV